MSKIFKEIRELIRGLGASKANKWITKNVV
jgi:hypothetical protein